MYLYKQPQSLAVPIQGLEEAIQQRKAQQEAGSPAQGAIIPPKAIPWLTGLVAVALVASRSLPQHTIAAQVAGGLVDVAVLLGLASPGWRRK
jgi:hypothetical protein